MNDSAGQVIIVVGMHRSGTSAITRGLQALGVELGDNLMEPGDCNVTGYWEDLDVNALNIAVLEALGLDWHHLTPIDPGALARLLASPLALRAVETVRAKLSQGRVFGLKDPRFARLIPFWRGIMDHLGVDARWLIASRHPMSVVRSLAQRDGFDATKSYLLWLEHVVAALRETDGLERCAVDYDRLVDDPLRDLERVAVALRLPFDAGGPQAIAYRDEFLRQSLRHTRYDPADLALEPEAPPLVADVHGALLDLATDAWRPESAAVIDRATAWLGDCGPVLAYADRREHQIADLRAAAARQAEREVALETAVAERETALEAAAAARETALEAAAAEHEGALAMVVAERDGRLAALEAERERLAAVARSFEQAVAERDDRLSGVEAAAAAAVAERDARIKAATADAVAQADRAAALAADLAERNHQLAMLRAETARLAEQLGTLKTALTERNDGVARLQAEVARAHEDIAGRDAATAALQAALAQQTERAAALAAALTERDLRLVALRAELAQAILPDVAVEAPPQVPEPPPARAVATSEVATSEATTGEEVEAPDVSIIIPAFKHLDDTLACLDSIARHSGDACSHEVLVADDGVDEPIIPWLPRMPGLTAWVNERNLGFLRNCNAAAKRARGRHLLFLNADTIVEADWLEPLVRLADGDPTVGMVGCTLLNTDGTIQDAGWTILADGWGLPIGRGDSPDQGEYGHVREVDCVGGACFLVPRAAFEAAGGFDDAFAPAYYEEFDLAFTLRRQGLRVLVQPTSRVRHRGSTAYGAETRDRLSTTNHATFIRKWAAEIADRPDRTQATAFELRERHGRRPAILMIDDRLPEYDHHAGGLSIDQYVRLLHRLGWRVIFAPADGEPREPYLARLRQAGIEIVHRPDSLADWLERYGHQLSVIWSARPDITLPLLPLFRRTSGARVAYFTHDLHYLRERRRYEVEGDPAILYAAAEMQTREVAIFRAVDLILPPSEEEAAIIRADAPDAKVLALPLYMYPDQPPPPPGRDAFAQRREIVFVGGFPHTPNVDAALWLVREIMPLVWAEEPALRLLLIGYDPPPDVRALAGPRVEVTGTVPDVAPYYARALLSVSPLRYGAGVKGKIVAAMAAGVPVVTTPVGAEGIGLTDGVSALVADDAAGIAAAILRLARAPELCASLARAGGEVVAQRFSEAAAARRLTAALGGEDPAADAPADADGQVDLADLSRRFCSQPWEYLEVYDGGVYVCCPAWNGNQAVGNIFTDQPEDIWNGATIQRFRQGILDGSFSACDKAKCHLIVGRRLPYRDDLSGKKHAADLRQIIAGEVTRLERGPRVVKLGYDPSCNLACPSCRTKVTVADGKQRTRLDEMFDRLVLPLLRDADTLLMSSDGDAFASHHYRHVLRLTAERYPALQLGLSTNGQLFDRRAWTELHLEGRVWLVQVSVDAATAETYEVVRRPGRFDRLLANLEFLASLRREGRIGKFELSCVVQERNYQELPDFIRLAKRLDADTAEFMLIDQWVRGMDGTAYRQAKIWDADHPRFGDFMRVLADPIFDDPIVRLNSLRAIRDGWQPPELRITSEGGIKRMATAAPAPNGAAFAGVGAAFAGLGVSAAFAGLGVSAAFAALRTAFPNARTHPDNLVRPDLVLVQAPAWGVNTPPLGTAMLSAAARARGFKVLPLDLNVEFHAARGADFADCWRLEESLWFWHSDDTVGAVLASQSERVDAFVELVAGCGAPVVGFTVYASALLATLALARRLKARRPDLLIVLGGPHVSRDIEGRQIVLDPAVDAVAQGEGEETLIDILERVRDGRTLDDCAGLLLRRDGAVVDTGNRPPIRDLDTLPVPDFTDFAFQAYGTPTRLPLMGSRGCPNPCIYCNERQYWKSFRFRSAEAIVAEIRTQLQRFPFLDFVDFQDSLVNGKISQLERFADLLVERGIAIQWAGQAVVRKEMTLELLLKLKRSGCSFLAYGLETLSPTLLNTTGKRLAKGADIDALVEAHGKSGTKAVYNVMFGLPGETEDDAFQMLEFLRRNAKYRPTVNPSPSFCVFRPGTPGYEHPERYGIDLGKGGRYWQSIDGTNTYPVRLKRFEAFCRLAAEVGIETTYPATRLLDRDRQLGHYYLACGDLRRARQHFRNWLGEHPGAHGIRDILARINAELGEEAIVHHLLPSTDDNWCNGIASGWATAFIVPDTGNARGDLIPGRTVVLADGSERTILETRPHADTVITFLEGPPLDGRRVGYPGSVLVKGEA